MVVQGIQLGLRQRPAVAINPRHVPRVLHTSGWTSGSTADGTSFVTTTIGVPAGCWLVLDIVNTGTGVQVPSSVVATTGSLAFTQQGTAFTVGTTNNCRSSIWARYFSAAYSGTVTIAYGSTATACCWAPLVLVGGPTSSAVVQVAMGKTATTGTALSANALAAFEHAANLCLAWNITRGPAVTPGSGFTEHGEASVISPAVVLQSQTATADTTADATQGSSGEWGAIALEFKAVA